MSLDFKNNWSNYRGHIWQIQCLPKGQPVTAKSLVLTIHTEEPEPIDLNEQQLKDLERLLKHELKNLCFVKNSIIHYNFFNKQLKLLVLDGTSVAANATNSGELERTFDKLSLDSSSVGDIFKVTNSTEIKISSDSWKKSDNNGLEESGYSITKDDIGGLHPQLNIIEEAIDFALGLREIPKGKYLPFLEVFINWTTIS